MALMQEQFISFKIRTDEHYGNILSPFEIALQHFQQFQLKADLTVTMDNPVLNARLILP